jgi:hypothetical protein
MGTRFLAQADHRDDDDTRLFQDYIGKYNKNYLTKDEFKARLSIFKENLAAIRGHDSSKEGFAVAINSFADLSREEFEKQMLGLRVPTELDAADA